MPNYVIQPLRPTAEDLRLFQNIASEKNKEDEEDEEEMQRSASINSLEDIVSEVNDIPSRNSTPSVCIDDNLSGHRNPAPVPPLELASRDSSLFASNDPFKDHSDINLRSDSEEEIVSESAQVEPIPEPTQSQRWNELNARLQLLEPIRAKVDVEKPLDAKSFNRNTMEKKIGDRFIYVNEQLIGQRVNAHSFERLPEIDYVKANKKVSTGKKKKPSGYSYRTLHQMHQLKSPTYDNNKKQEISNIFDQPLDKPSLRPKKRSKSNRSIDSVVYPTVDSSTQNGENNLNLQESPDRPEEKHAKDSKRTKKKERRKTIPICSLHPRPILSPNSRRRTILHDIDPDRSEREYCANSYSASGIYRLCMEQQADLVQAHQDYREKHSVNSPDSLFTGPHRRGPAYDFPKRSNSSLTSMSGEHRLKPLFPDPFKTREPKRSESWQSDMRKQRYTLRDYALLPNVNSQIKGLGPDLQSEKYREKLAKRERQTNYAERLREKRSSSNHVARLEPTSEEPEQPSPNTLLNGSWIQIVREVPAPPPPPPPVAAASAPPPPPQPSQLKTDVMNGISESTSTTNRSERQPSVHTVNSKLNGSVGGILNGADKTRELPVNGFTELTQEELERKKAMEKRQAMLNYAKRVQTKMSDKRKRSRNENSTVQKLPNENNSNGFEDMKFTDARLMELLLRHEQDRRFAEAIQQTLKIGP